MGAITAPNPRAWTCPPTTASRSHPSYEHRPLRRPVARSASRMNDSILGTASALPSMFHAHTARSSLTTSVSDMERARARGDDLARRPSRAVTVSRANECERVRCILGTHPSISTTRGVDRARASRERPSANDSLDAPSLERRARTASRRRRPKTGVPRLFIHRLQRRSRERFRDFESLLS